MGCSFHELMSCLYDYREVAVVSCPAQVLSQVCHPGVFQEIITGFSFEGIPASIAGSALLNLHSFNKRM